MGTKISYKLIAAVGGVTIAIIGIFAYLILESREQLLLKYRRLMERSA